MFQIDELQDVMMNPSQTHSVNSTLDTNTSSEYTDMQQNISEPTNPWILNVSQVAIMEELYYYYLWTYVAPTLFACIILIGIIGNSLVIYTICSSKVKRTSTNLLLLNLAITDILFLLVCVPFKAHKYAASQWALGDAVCMGTQYLAYVSTYVTIWSLVAVSVIRFLSVVYSNSVVKVQLKKNVIVVIAMIWVLSLCANIPSLLAHTTKTMGSYTYCGMHEHAMEGVFVSFFTFAYVIPLLGISIMYVLILLYLNHHSTSAGVDPMQVRSRQRKHKVFKIVLVVVLVFAISWLPFHVNILLGLYGTVPQGMAYEALRILWDCLAYGNSCANPIIYNYVSRDFRTAFKQVMCGKIYEKKCGKRSGAQDREARELRVEHGRSGRSDMTHVPILLQNHH